MRVSGEALTAGFDAVSAEINNMEFVADVLKVLRPAAMPGRNLQDAPTREKRMQAEV